MQPDLRRPIRRALVSVYDKTGLVDLAQALKAHDVTIVSTGSTARTIAEAGISVTPVEDVTGFPEILDGRVKTLHPYIHAGILADQRLEDHRKQLNDLDIEPFDLVVCNLYPFEQTVASGANYDDTIEQIDIGGPSMVRAAAKNHASIAVITNPSHYGDVVNALTQGGFTFEQRRSLAADAFAHTARYDAAIAAWFAAQINEGNTTEPSSVLPEKITLSLTRVASLRYGENPHQQAALYSSGETGGIAGAHQLHGKAMSYNNYSDAGAALRAAYDHRGPCVAIIKHANPCGIAIADTVEEAYAKAHACDPMSAYGGVIAVNRPVTIAMAQAVAKVFTEVILAPGYEEGSVEILSKKKNLRILQIETPIHGGLELKPVSGGVLVQEIDDIDDEGDNPANWTLAAGAPADAATLRDLEFAWRTIRSVRSNAILIAKDGASVGVGMGQVNRVDSCRLAVERANTLGGPEESTLSDARTDKATSSIESPGGARSEDVIAGRPAKRTRGAVASSDAFFPFADGLQVLIDAGVTAVVQPGGSIHDQESIDAAKAAGITMYLTGTRHFAH